MRVSFDYWGTISVKKYQMEAKALLKNHEVFLITRGKYIEDARRIAAEIGIKPENVHSTNGEDKGEIMKALMIDAHYDDDDNQIKAIVNSGAKTLCVKVNKNAYRNSNFDHRLKNYV